MTYISYPAPVLPYHLDGTVLKEIDVSAGVIKTFSAGEMLEMNDEDYTVVLTNGTCQSTSDWLVLFFPELVDIESIFTIGRTSWGGDSISALTTLEWSADTTNGLDGTWAAATMPGGFPGTAMNFDSWRTGFKAISDIIGAGAIRMRYSNAGFILSGIYILHLYGHKHAAETPDDILFLDPENADAEYTLPMDFGDVPTGTSTQRQIKFKNDSASKTASTIVITVVDPDDQIRIGVSNTGPWLTSQTIASLAHGVSSSVYYVKCEAPAPPAALGPNRAPIKCVVGSWA
jgi:hypothetical protein